MEEETRKKIQLNSLSALVLIIMTGFILSFFASKFSPTIVNISTAALIAGGTISTITAALSTRRKDFENIFNRPVRVRAEGVADRENAQQINQAPNQNAAEVEPQLAAAANPDNNLAENIPLQNLGGENHHEEEETIGKRALNIRETAFLSNNAAAPYEMSSDTASIAENEEEDAVQLFTTETKAWTARGNNWKIGKDDEVEISQAQTASDEARSDAKTPNENNKTANKVGRGTRRVGPALTELSDATAAQVAPNLDLFKGG